MNLKNTLVSIIFLLIFSLPLYSEPAALILNYIEISDDVLRMETESQIKKQLEKELNRQNLGYWDESFVASTIRELNLSGKQLIDEAAALKLGEVAEVPVVITVEAVEKENFLEFTITAWDIVKQEKIAIDRKVSRTAVTRYIMINSSITNITDKLTGEYGIASIKTEPKVRKITFISNQEGLGVFMPDGEYLGEIVHSVLNITDREFDIGTKLLITKKLEGHREAEQWILLDSEKSAVPLSDLNKANILALEMNWTYLQLMGLGFGIRYYPVPDWMYVSFDNYYYLQKDFSTDYGAEVVHNDLRFLAGFYIKWGPESLFRLGVALGGGVIFSYPIDRAGTFNDYYLSPLNLSLEFNPLKNWSFFLRPELKISIGIGDNTLYGDGVILSEYNIPPITIGALRKW